MNQFFAKKWVPLFLLGIATFLVWGQTVTFGFVWDDDFFIKNLQSVRSLHNIPAMFYRLDAQATLPESFEVFRPIRTAFYALLHSLDGHEIPQPWIYHLANVLWHAATAMMLFAALVLLLGRLCKHLTAAEVRGWSFWVALAFAIHPVVSEVVCWAKSLDDILATFFTLAALREVLLPPENRAARWRGWLFFLLAVYSKESAVPFAVLPFFVFRKIHRLSWKDSLRRTSVFCVIAVLYLIHRQLVIGRTSQTAPISGTYAQTLIDMLPVVPMYFRLLSGVSPFCIDYNYQLPGGHAFWSAPVLGGLGLLLVLVVMGLVAWRKSGWELLGFGLLWTGLFLLPVSNLVPMMQYMAERFLYLPLIGWLTALVAIVSQLPKQPILRPAAMVILLVWGFTAWNRSWIWQDQLTLFVRTSQENPKTARVELNAVSAILSSPSVQDFVSDHSENKTGLTAANAETERANRALNVLAEAYRLYPENHDVLACYGVALAKAGQDRPALTMLEKAAEMKPEQLNDWLNLARSAITAGAYSQANSALQQAATLSPENPEVLQMRFNLCWQTQDYISARKVLQQLDQIAPSASISNWLSQVDKKLNLTNQPDSTPIPK